MAEYPRKCECGGKMQYTRSLGLVFSACLKCTPVVTIKVARGIEKATGIRCHELRPDVFPAPEAR